MPPRGRGQGQTSAPTMCGGQAHLPLQVGSVAVKRPCGVAGVPVGILEGGAAAKARQHILRSMSHPLSRTTSGGGAASLRAVAGRIACKAARLCAAFSCPWTSLLTATPCEQVRDARLPSMTATVSLGPVGRLILPGILRPEVGTTLDTLALRLRQSLARVFYTAKTPEEPVASPCPQRWHGSTVWTGGAGWGRVGPSDGPWDDGLVPFRVIRAADACMSSSRAKK